MYVFSTKRAINKHSIFIPHGKACFNISWKFDYVETIFQILQFDTT